MKRRRQFGETYIVRKVSRICFWLHEHLVQPESWTLPFCLQLEVILVISWSSSTPSAVTSANDSQIFLMIKFPKGEDHYSEFLIVEGFLLLFASLTCRQEQFITVLGASWCSHSTWEQHTVVYPKGKNFFKTSCSNGWPYFNCSVLDPGLVPEIQRSIKVFYFGIVSIEVDFSHISWCCPILSTTYRSLSN